MNKKTVVLFQDNNSYDFNLENRLTALLFDKETVKQAEDIIYEENEDCEPVNNFKTMAEIKEALDKNSVRYEEIDLIFFDYNNEED